MFHRRRLLGAVRAPFVAASGGPATWTATANPAEGSAGTTITFTSVALGAADPSRVTAVLVHTEAVIATGVSVGGIAMTKAIEEASAISSLQIWVAVTSSLGTTANIVLTAGGSMSFPMIMVGRFTGITSFSTATNAVNEAGNDPATITATVPTGGFGLAGITTQGATTGTWSNVTQDYRVNTTSNKTVSLAHTNTAGSQTPTYTGMSGQISHMVMACFGP